MELKTSSRMENYFKVTTLESSSGSEKKIKCVQISDIHTGPITPIEHIKFGFEIVKNLKPDVIFFTGDLVQNSFLGFNHTFNKRYSAKVFKWRNYRRRVRELVLEVNDLFFKTLGDIKCYGVPGNHDYHDGINTVMDNFQIQWLVNKSIINHELKLNIVGLDDFRLGKPSLEVATKEFCVSEYLNILLAHNPDYLTVEAPNLINKFDLALSGHTHGGQIVLPFLGTLVTRTKQKEYFSGHGKFNQTNIYVNQGFGYGGVPIRLNCPPEITEILL